VPSPAPGEEELQAPVHGVKKIKPDCFSVAPSDSIRGNGHKLKPMKFHLNTRKCFFTVRVIKYTNMLSRVAVESRFLEILKTWLGMVLGNLLEVTLL